MPEREATDTERQAHGAAKSDNPSGTGAQEAGEHEVAPAPDAAALAAQDNVLASLPRRRPGRRTKRRSPAADGGGARAAAPTPGAGTQASRPKASRGARTSTRKKASAPRAGAAARAPASRGAKRTPGKSGSGIQIPAQGFETEGVRMGTAVEPPSRVEMATSLIEAAAEGFEELAKAGAVAGGAAFKRALSLLPKR